MVNKSAHENKGLSCAAECYSIALNNYSKSADMTIKIQMTRQQVYICRLTSGSYTSLCELMFPLSNHTRRSISFCKSIIEASELSHVAS